MTELLKHANSVYIMEASELYVSCCQVNDTETRLECLLNNNKNSDFCAPLTSFDWNEVDPNLLGESPQLCGIVVTVDYYCNCKLFKIICVD